MKTYHFTVTLQGSGDDPQDAWQDAVEAFQLDPGEPHETKLIEEDVPELFKGTNKALDNLTSLKEHDETSIGYGDLEDEWSPGYIDPNKIKS